MNAKSITVPSLHRRPTADFWVLFGRVLGRYGRVHCRLRSRSAYHDRCQWGRKLRQRRSGPLPETSWCSTTWG